MREFITELLLVFVCYVISVTSATVLLKPLSVSFPDLPAKFAVDVDNSGICGALHVADPLNACSPIRSRSGLNGTEQQTRFVLIVRGECGFQEKVMNSQNAGFNAAIVYNDRDKANLVYMMVNPEGIKVHAVFVSKAAGEMLKEGARGEPGECCIYPVLNGKAWTVLAISFLSLLVILVLLLIVFFTPRHWLNWQSRNHHPKSVDTKMVEALPCFAFSSACSSNCRSGETCAICLEDYKDGEIVKVLPCQHEFHSSCVDSWLTKWGTFCPVCKLDMRTIIAKSEIKGAIWL